MKPPSGLDETVASGPAAETLRAPAALGDTVASPTAALGDTVVPAALGDTVVPSPLGDTIAAKSTPSAGASSPGSKSTADYETLPQVTAEHYVIAGTLARGGMGRILRARDRRLGRDVAIKELLAKSPELAARFEREVRITAQLQHPSIVTVHEAGHWANGDPFYAMELLGGRALDVVMRAANGFAERLALVPHVIAVADALAYAHSRGVIHRDLKPANVLVGEFGETVVIDWGLAKDLRSGEESLPAAAPVASRDSAETAFGAVVGTPSFMPPEQARGERADQRADVYAIGAMLYAVLAGRAPFVGDSVERILASVTKERPPNLISITPEAPPDLVAIVDKAMAPLPQDRYQDARELAQDLRRFQTGQLVGARRYTTVQRLRRFIARHRVVVSVIAVAALVLAIVSTIMIRRIVDERDTAQAARHDAETQRSLADGQRKLSDEQRAAAEHLVGFMLTELKPQLDRVGRVDLMEGVAKNVDDYYARLIQTPGALDQHALDQRAAALQVLGDVLATAGDSSDANRAYRAVIALEGSAEGRPAVLALARAQIELGASLLDQGDLDGAGAAVERGRVPLEALASRAPTEELALATAYRRLGMIAFQRGHNDDAITQLSHCIDHARIASIGAQDSAAKKELAKCHDRYSDVASALNNRSGAEHAVREALEIRKQIMRDDPGDLDVRLGIGVSWDKLYILAVAANEPAKAKAASDAAIALAEPLVERDPDNAQWARMLMNALLRKADMASNADQPAAAARVAAQAATVAEQLVTRAPHDADRIADLADVLGKQGTYLVDARQLDAALETLRRALGLAEQASAITPANTQYRWGVATIHEYVGDALKARGDFAGAAGEYRARLDIDEELLRNSPDEARKKLNVATTRFLLGDVLAKQPAHHDEGVAAMTTSLATLHELAAAGQLSADFATNLPEMEAALAKASRSRR